MGPGKIVTPSTLFFNRGMTMSTPCPTGFLVLLCIGCFRGTPVCNNYDQPRRAPECRFTLPSGHYYAPKQRMNGAEEGSRYFVPEPTVATFYEKRTAGSRLHVAAHDTFWGKLCQSCKKDECE